MAEVAQKVREIIAEHLAVAEASVTDSQRLVDDLHADSLDVVELVMAFEEAFRIEISDEEADSKVYGDNVTVGDVVKFIEGKAA